LLTIKPVGSMKSFFDGDEYTIDVKSCVDVILYIQAMHPRLGLFMKQAEIFGTFEDVCFLDKKGEVIDPQLFPFHKFKEDDELYIAPVIAGGGGRVGIIAIVAVVAIGVATGGFGFAAAPAMTSAATAKMQTAFVAGASTSLSAFSITSVITNIAISLALNLVQSLFTSTPKARTREITKDSGTRTQNDAFGSLQNSSVSGTPIALNYGQMRVGGQFLSGYILSQQHAQNDAPTIAQIFDANQSPLASEAEEAA